jgi:hypothetical protein
VRFGMAVLGNLLNERIGRRRRFFCTDWRSWASAAKSRDNSSASGTFKAMGLEEDEEGEESCSSSSSDARGESEVDSDDITLESRSESDSASKEYGFSWSIKFGGRSRVKSPEVIWKEDSNGITSGCRVARTNTAVQKRKERSQVVLLVTYYRLNYGYSGVPPDG